MRSAKTRLGSGKGEVANRYRIVCSVYFTVKQMQCTLGFHGGRWQSCLRLEAAGSGTFPQGLKPL